MSQAYEVLSLSQLRENVALWVRLRPLVLAPLSLVYMTLHWLSGVRGPRFYALTAIWAVLLASHFNNDRKLRSGVHRFSEERAFRGVIIHLGLHAALLALTGGLRSALLPMLYGPTLGAVLTHRRSRHSDLVVGFTTLVVAGLWLAPHAWLGARIAAPYDAVVSGLALLTSVMLLRYTILLSSDSNRRVAESLGRMRHDVLVDATERARSLETMSAKVAHELKNPLAAIKGLVQLMGRGEVLPKNAERLKVVEEEVTRMEGILRNYLSFSSPAEALRPSAVDLLVLADDVLAVLEARAVEAGVLLHAEGESVVIQADPQRLKEALLNLVANALEATPRDGVVSLFVAPTEKGAELRIQDTGRGMTPEVLRRLGTAFFTTRPEGTGLGVVLARSVIERHGGTLTYESVPDDGTTATLTLPRTARVCEKEPV